MNKVYLVILLFAAACATVEKHEAKLQSWVGKPVDQLIMAWGQPAGVTDVGNGKKMYHFNWSSAPVYNTTANAFTGVQTTSYQNYCNNTFMIDNGTVTSWSWKGNTCVSD